MASKNGDSDFGVMNFIDCYDNLSEVTIIAKTYYKYKYKLFQAVHTNPIPDQNDTAFLIR